MASQLASVALRMAGAVAGPEIDRRYAAAPFAEARELLRSLEGAGEIDPSIDGYDSLEREVDRVLSALRAEADLLASPSEDPLAMSDHSLPRAR
ncbi:MAG: hypothetical protein HY720_09560 [Planctomycetes bacterium]|nr:hypothetical protein [Planctomycetota bacterium]